MRRHLYSSKAVPEGSHQVVAKALKALTQECQIAGTKSAWIVTPTRDNLDGYISETIGDAAAGALAKGNSVDIGAGVLLRHYTMRTLPYGGDGSPLLALYLDDKSLTKLDGMRNIPSVIVVPWLDEDIAKWKQAHGPKDICGEADAHAAQLTNPVVAVALEELLSTINKSTGISHPSDKRRAIETFKLLKTGGEQYNPAEVRAWLVQKGLAAKHADAIAAIAASPGSARTPRGLGELGEGFLDRWRQEAAD